MGPVYDGARGKEVWDRYYGDLDLFLGSGNNVIADATNLVIGHRDRTLEVGRKHAATRHAIVFMNIEQAISRNLKREGGDRQGNQRVPDSAMINFVSLYEETLRRVPTEGYDSITYVKETA